MAVKGTTKQSILDALIQTTMEEYEKHSIFANANWEFPCGWVSVTGNRSVKRK